MSQRTNVFGRGIRFVFVMAILAGALGAAAETITIGTNQYPLTPRRAGQEKLQAGLIQAEHQRQGMVWYLRGDLRDVYPDSVPRPNEMKSEVAGFAAGGQVAAFWFSVYALRDLTNAQAAITADLKNEQGQGMAASAIRIKTVRFWPQYTIDVGSSVYIIPELLIDKTLVEKIPANSSQSFWLQASIPAGCPAGNYKGQIAFTFNSGETINIPLRLNVLPFELLTPDPKKNWWQIYVTPKIFGEMTEDQMTEEFKYLKSYGFTGLIMRLYYANTPWSFVTTDGQITDFKSDYLERIQRARVRAKMTGPLSLWWHGMVEERVAADMGLKSERMDINVKAGFYKVDLNNPELRRGIVDAFKAIDKAVKRYGGEEYGKWYYYGLDEPAWCEYAMNRARQMYSLAKEAGVPGMDTCYGAAYNQLRDVCEIQLDCGSRRGDDAPAGEPWWSLDGGCYGRQEGGLMPDRYLSGFQFYKNGAQASVSWTYQWGFGGNPYDEIMTGNKANITYPPWPEAGITNTIATLQWEGIREGISDYRYCFTLVQVADQCRSAGLGNLAEQALNRLQYALSLFPGKKDYDFTDVIIERKFDNELAQRCRWLLASEIIRMKEALALNSAQKTKPTETSKGK